MTDKELRADIENIELLRTSAEAARDTELAAHRAVDLADAIAELVIKLIEEGIVKRQSEYDNHIS